MDEEIEWHIGWHNKTVTESAKEELLMLLSKWKKFYLEF
jgi:hypothetical protein